MEEGLLRSVEIQGVNGERSLEREPWNLAVVGFCEGHPAGNVWPMNIDGVTKPMRAMKSLLGFYAALDRAVGPSWRPSGRCGFLSSVETESARIAAHGISCLQRWSDLDTLARSRERGGRSAPVR